MATTRSIAVTVAAVAAALLAVPATAHAAGGRPPGAGGGRGGGETTIGNNLSTPVLFASNVGILGMPVSEGGATPWADPNTGLRMPPSAAGQYTQPQTFTLPTGSVTVWPQAMEGNSWQASWLANGAGSTYNTIANWGDNILGSNGTVKAFAVNTAIRIEVRLTPASDTTPDLSGRFYQPMISNGLTGTAEKWAASQPSLAAVTGSVMPTVFTGGAKLTITPVVSGSDVTPIGSPVLTSNVSKTFVPADAEGSGSTSGTAPIRLAGELNASGAVVYGLNLYPQQVSGMAPGWYKITFSVDNTFDNGATGATGMPSLAKVTGVDPADAASGESGEITPAGATAPGRAWYDAADNSTSVVIQITTDQSGRRGGGGGGRG